MNVDRDHLKAALDRVKPAVSNRPPLAVLSCVRIDRHGVTATDLDLTVTAPLPADGRIDAVVPHAALSALAARLPDGPVGLELDRSDLRVTAGRTKATLRCAAVGDWPKLDPVTGDTVTLAGDWYAVGRVLHAASVDPGRPVLCHAHIGGGWAEATDSYRAARHPVDCGLDVMIHAAHLRAVVAATGDGPVDVCTDGRRWSITGDGCTWRGSCLDGDYPNVAGVIPKAPPLSLTVPRDELVDALASAALFGEQMDAGRLVRLEVDGDTVTVAAAQADRGDAAVDVSADADGFDGPFTVGFSSGYLAEALGACLADKVTLRGADTLKPWRVDDGDLVQAVMPVLLVQP